MESSPPWRAMAAFLAGGSVATNTGLYNPLGVATDNAGNFYIADTYNHRIRKVTPSGSMTTVAGTGSSGSNGDNGSATSAQVNTPNGVAVDGAGNIYIADSSNNRIRKVNPQGIISTIAGNGRTGYSGDGGSATSAMLSFPSTVCVDAYGNISIADWGNNRIRRLGTNGLITTVAGSGAAGFSGDGGLATNANLTFPQGVSVDKTGNLYVAEGSQRIRKVGTNGIITTVAGRNLNDGDIALNATLNSPYQAVQDGFGNFFVADSANQRIRKIDTNGIISTFAGNGIPMYSGDGGPATSAGLYFPNAVAMDAVGNLFISDQSRRIRKVDTNGNIITMAGNGAYTYSGEGGLATNAGIGVPDALILDASGNLFIASQSAFRIFKVDTNGIIKTVAGNGSPFYSGEGGLATSAGIGLPGPLALDSSGNLFIAGQTAYRILKVDTNGIIKTVAGNGTPGDSGDGGAATNAQFKLPYGIAFDPPGNLYVSDPGSARIRKVGTNGVITTVAGNGIRGVPMENMVGTSAGLSIPDGLMIDAKGNLVFVDLGANRLRKVTNLEYADQPAFTVTNVTSTSLTDTYSVIVTSASGSVTSSVVNLGVQLPPVIPSFNAANGLCTFTWNAVSNLTYQLQCATNLSTPVWQDLGSPATATSNIISMSDTNGIGNERFYRVRLWP
ncbi:MAG: hypothetical protein WCS94_17185 [Verrucomicrobiota bacterium]